MNRLLRLITGLLVAMAPMMIVVNACGYTWGETEIPECLREE